MPITSFSKFELFFNPRHLSKEQIEAQKQDFAYGLSESLQKQLYWELSQARVEAKNQNR